jgi:hypothetical protein
MADWRSFLKDNSSALTQMGAGLLGGQTGTAQLAGGLSGFSQGRQQNKTLDFLREKDPELAQLVEQGALTGGDAAKLYYNRKLESEKPAGFMNVGGVLVNDRDGSMVADYRQPKQPDLKVFPDGSYGTWDGQNVNILGNAGKTPQNEVEARKQSAADLGLAPEDPRYQSYVLTGKMPREDAQPLSPGDKQAILQADEQVQTNQTAIDALEKAKSVNENANSGYGAGARATIGNNLPDWMVPDAVSSPGSSAATADYDNLVIGTALTQLKSIFGGNPTEGERQILLDLQGSSNLPPPVRARILDRAQQAAQRRLEFNQQRAEQLRGGTYYQPAGGGVGGAAPVGKTSSGLTFKIKGQ